MRGTRHESIGIKQAIRFEWMQKTANLLMAGLDAKTIRQELHEFLADRKGNGSEGTRSNQTRTFVVNNLMKIWVSPDPELIPFRDASLAFLRKNPSMALAVHWGMTQIIDRLKEQYGDRQTVSRYGRFVIRSFIAWDVLKDSQSKGCYEKTVPVSIVEPDLAILMLESALLATPEAKGAMVLLLNNTAFFPFWLPMMTGDFVSLHNDRIEMVRYGLDDELLKLKGS